MNRREKKTARSKGGDAAARKGTGGEEVAVKLKKKPEIQDKKKKYTQSGQQIAQTVASNFRIGK